MKSPLTSRSVPTISEPATMNSIITVDDQPMIWPKLEAPK